MKEAIIRVDARTKSVRELLNGSKYSIDFYQREYKWETRHVTELLDDLESKFFENYQSKHGRKEVEKYAHYFLGSIVISRKSGQSFIIDGQQRLTSLTLLLIYLNNLQQGQANEVDVSPLIFSEKYGSKSFNLDVQERIEVIDALYNGRAFELNGQPESVRNIVMRYQDIEGAFPDSLKGDALPFFIDWLTKNVDFVEITAFSDDEAYTIFETMNDRGLSLSPTDMLKG